MLSLLFELLVPGLVSKEAVRLRKERALGSPDLGSNPTLSLPGIILGKPFDLSNSLFYYL